MSFSKLLGVGRDLNKILYRWSYLMAVILLVILFADLKGTQLSPLSEEAYAPMVILLVIDKH
jgi:hypothetical protein